MNITKVKYERLFPVGAYLNEKIGFEADLVQITNIDTFEKTSESPNEAIEKLRQLAEVIHKEKYPELYTDEMKGTTIKPVEEEVPKSTKEQYLLDLISMSTTKVGLERFRNQITELNNEEVNRSFDKRMNEVD